MSRITVLRSSVSIPAGKTYQVCELGYKTDEGKVKGMRIFGFGDMKPVFDVAAKAVNGDILDAAFEQNAKNYWQFASLTATGEKMATTSSASVPGPTKDAPTVKGGTWETREERASRQVLIVRQSSLSNALKYFEVVKGKPTVEDVFQLADQMDDFVFDVKEATVE